MKKRTVLIGLFVMLFLMSGCKSLTTGKVTVNVCDDLCQQERDEYVQGINTFLAQAQVITSKIEYWKSVTKKDLGDITSLRDQVSDLKVPKDFELVHDYYSRAFGHYVEAVTHVVTANDMLSQASGSSNTQLHNAELTKVVDNIQEARKIMVYADEEVKFANNVIPKA